MATQTNLDLAEAFDAIKNKQARYDLLYNYYGGLHPLKYSATRLKKAFERLDTYFAENWVAVIVDSVLDRLSLRGFDVSGNDDAKAKLTEIFKDYNMELIADDIHEAATITGEGYIIALPNYDDETGEELDDTKYDIYFNDPRMCHVFYEFDSPNKKRFAAKIFAGDDRFVRMALYYPDHFEYYKSNKQVKGKESIFTATAASFQPDPDLPDEPNDLNIIPVFHFSTGRISKRKDLGPSEISLQDAINKLLTDMLVSAEFNTFIQRVIISQSDPGNLQNEAGANWWIPAGDGKSQQTQVMELGGRSLDGFLNAIDKLATALAIISRTPKYYFFDQGRDPSGEALITMEAPLIKKVYKRIRSFSVEWQNFARYMLLLEGIKDIKRSQIIPSYDPPETVQPKTNADVVKVETDSGVPLVTSLRWHGKTDEQIKQMEDDQKKEQKNKSGLALDALNKLRQQDQNSNDNGGVPNSPNNNMMNNNQMNNQMNKPVTPGTNVAGSGQ